MSKADDRDQFSGAAIDALGAAVSDHGWLLSRGYAETSSLKLVGDRYGLTARQRAAVSRCSCSDQALQRRLHTRIPGDALYGQPLALDGYNLLTVVTSAMAGQVVLRGREGALRDLAGIHGGPRSETAMAAAARLVGEVLGHLGGGAVTWYLDQAISRSGQLRHLLLSLAREASWAWEAELVLDPDPILAASGAVVATGDRWILDRCARWTPLAAQLVQRHLPDTWIVDLGATASPAAVTGDLAVRAAVLTE